MPHPTPTEIRADPEAGTRGMTRYDHVATTDGLSPEIHAGRVPGEKLVEYQWSARTTHALAYIDVRDVAEADGDWMLVYTAGGERIFAYTASWYEVWSAARDLAAWQWDAAFRYWVGDYIATATAGDCDGTLWADRDDRPTVTAAEIGACTGLSAAERERKAAKRYHS